MPALSLRRALAAAVCAAIAGATLASAQHRGPRERSGGADHGGGAIAAPVRERSVARDMVLSLRGPAGGRVAVDGNMFAPCGLGTIRGTAPLRAGRRFTLRGTTSRRPARGVRVRSTFTVSGRATAEGFIGTARLRLRVRRRGARTRTCSSREVAWRVRRIAPADAGPAPAPAGATLYGAQSQRATRARRAVVLRTSAGGRTVERAVFAFRTSCRDRRVVVSDDVNVSGEFEVAPDGSFRHVERYRVGYPDSIMRATALIKGRFDSSGAAAGRLYVTERYQDRRTGRRHDVCRTGTRSWSARP